MRPTTMRPTRIDNSIRMKLTDIESVVSGIFVHRPTASEVETASVSASEAVTADLHAMKTALAAHFPHGNTLDQFSEMVDAICSVSCDDIATKPTLERRGQLFPYGNVHRDIQPFVSTLKVTDHVYDHEAHKVIAATAATATAAAVTAARMASGRSPAVPRTCAPGKSRA